MPQGHVHNSIFLKPVESLEIENLLISFKKIVPFLWGDIISYF